MKNQKKNMLASSLMLAAIGTCSHAATLKDQQATYTKQGQALVGERYIVMLKQQPLAMYAQQQGKTTVNLMLSGSKGSKLPLHISSLSAYNQQLLQAQGSVKAAIQTAIGRAVDVQSQQTLALNAMVMQLSAAEAQRIAKLPHVLRVEKETFSPLATDESASQVGAAALWADPRFSSGAKGEGVVLGVLDTGIASYKKRLYSWSTPNKADFNPSFADIAADGYDHTNPFGTGQYFGDCATQAFWCNDKLVGVVSFPGLTAEVSVSDKRRNTGQDDHGHGTHVASTAAGNLVTNAPLVTAQVINPSSYSPFEVATSQFKLSLSGIAPHANIVAYKTCTASNGCSSVAAIEAIEHAIANGVDVINYSVGGSPESPWSRAEALAFLSARAAGIYVSVAAGNSGPEGGTVGAPGNSPWVTTVGASTHGRAFTDDKTVQFSGGDYALPEMTGKGATFGLPSDTELVYGGDVEDAYYQTQQGGEGFCSANALPASYRTPNVVGKVLICKRGGALNGIGLSRLSKSIAAKAKGAVGLILINSSDSPDTLVGDLHEIPTIHLNKADGEALLAWMHTGNTVKKAKIIGDAQKISDPNEADIMASFSSRGPDAVNQDYLVPDVTAPGVDVYASGIGSNQYAVTLDAVSKTPGDFVSMSGTSMATPNVAGMYVLLKQQHPEWSPAEAQSALMTTAFTQVREKQADGSLAQASNFAMGAGAARVNRAVDAGLVLDETEQGYLAANPDATPAEQSSIVGWHGKPYQMNMPSLARSHCLIDCSWTRTFKATKAGHWTLSTHSNDDGFSLSVEPQELQLDAGETATVTFTATADQSLQKQWVEGRIMLTPADTTMPEQSLPVVVNFIAGSKPDAVQVTAGRNQASTQVHDIRTIGTQQLQVSKSGLAKAKIYEFSLRRDESNAVILPNLRTMDDTTYAIPLNIQSDSKRLVIEVLGTTSNDLDLYVGIDSDLSGDPTGKSAEFDYLVYAAATEKALETIDVLNPRHDTYWLMVHNFQAGPAPLQENEVVCEPEQEPPVGKTCAAAPIYDTVKLAVTQVDYDDATMQVTAPASVQPKEEVPTTLSWDLPQAKTGDIYHGVMTLGTSPELADNIGTVRVDLVRGDDDVAMLAPSVQHDSVSNSLRIAANNGADPVSYRFEVQYPAGAVINSVDADRADSVSTKVISGAKATFVLTQAAGATEQQVTLMADYQAVQGKVSLQPMVNSWLANQTNGVALLPQPDLWFYGRPVFELSANKTTLNAGETVTLAAKVRDAVVADAVITHQWQQIAGASASMVTMADGSVQVTAPKLSADDTLVFQHVGSNGQRQSKATTVEVKVWRSPDGGSVGFGWGLGLLGVALMRRRLRRASK